MSEVRVKEGESLENALKRFKRSCAKAGVIAEARPLAVERKARQLHEKSLGPAGKRVNR